VFIWEQFGWVPVSKTIGTQFSTVVPDRLDPESTLGSSRRYWLALEAAFWTVVQNFRQIGGTVAEIEEKAVGFSALCAINMPNGHPLR